MPITVPDDFLGMCFITFPNSGNSPVGKINWGSHRMGQMPATRWATIETSAGIYSSTALQALDDLITFQRQNHAKVHFGLYATPVFYASTAPHPTYGDHVTKGPWGLLGECAYPTSLSAVTSFVHLILERYNRPGGVWFDRFGRYLGKGIAYWETWNEPNNANGNGNSSGSGGSGTGFWWGTNAELVDLAQTQYAAVKAIDPSVIVTTPGFDASKTDFLTSVGSITGKTGAESCDAYAWHPYNHNPAGEFYGLWKNDILFGVNGVIPLRNKLADLGLGHLPIHINEWGVDHGTATADQIAWYAASTEFRYTWMARFLMTCAVYGVQSVHPWHWNITGGSYGNSGDWQLDIDGVQKAYNDVAKHVVGKTIISANIGVPGPVTLIFSDLTSFSV